MAYIQFRTQFWDTNDSTHQGLTWDGTFGINEQEVIEQKTATGTGTFVKQVGKKPTQVTLELLWRTTNPAALCSILADESDGQTRTLYTPLINAEQCRLSSISNLNFKATEVCGEGGFYIVSATLTFAKYPTVS